MSNVYIDRKDKLNKGQVKKVVAFLKELAKTAKPDDDYFGICYNLNKFIWSFGGKACGYEIVSNMSVGFPDVVMCDINVGRACTYPIGICHDEKVWEVGNRRTKLCTHIADRLESLL